MKPNTSPEKLPAGRARTLPESSLQRTRKPQVWRPRSRRAKVPSRRLEDRTGLAEQPTNAGLRSCALYPPRAPPRTPLARLEVSPLLLPRASGSPLFPFPAPRGLLSSPAPRGLPSSPLPLLGVSPPHLLCCASGSPLRPRPLPSTRQAPPAARPSPPTSSWAPSSAPRLLPARRDRPWPKALPGFPSSSPPCAVPPCPPVPSRWPSGLPQPGRCPAPRNRATPSPQAPPGRPQDTHSRKFYPEIQTSSNPRRLRRVI